MRCESGSGCLELPMCRAGRRVTLRWEIELASAMNRGGLCHHNKQSGGLVAFSQS